LAFFNICINKLGHWKECTEEAREKFKVYVIEGISQGEMDGNIKFILIYYTVSYTPFVDT
jgi:hypothetical protein